MKKIGIISLIIGISTYILKLVDVFPEQKEILKIVSFIFFGIVIGVVISRFTKDEVELKEFSLREFFPYFYYGFLGIMFLIILISLIQIENMEKVNTLTGWLSTIGGFIVASLIFNFHNIFSSGGYTISLEDKLILAETYRLEKNYSKSLNFYESIKDNLVEEDIRFKEIEKEIDEVKSLQLDRRRLKANTEK